MAELPPLPPGFQLVEPQGVPPPPPGFVLQPGVVVQPGAAFAPVKPDSGGVVGQGMSGVNEGIANFIGTPVDAVNSALGGMGDLLSRATGANVQLSSPEPVMGSAYWKRVMGSPVPSTDARMIRPPSDVPVEAFARTAGQGAGAALPAALTMGASLPASVAMATGSGLGRATAGAVSKDNPWAMAAGELAGGSLATGVERWIANRAAQRAAEGAVSTVDELTDQAGALYDAAERNGVTATQQQTQGLNGVIRQIATTEGLISPTGRVATSYPKVSDALNMVDDYAQGTMTPTQMRSVRRSIQGAARSKDPDERRIGSMMLEEFDNFVSPLAPEFAQANALYTRAMRGRDLEELRDLAASNAGKFTGSGFENALRTQYRGLEQKIIRGTERGWSPEEQEAIQDVSRGTRGSNIARNLGRAAPTGVVSFGGTVGVPFMIGNAIGGPALGAALSTGAAMGGYGARAIATRMGSRNADIAELLARNGMPVAPANITPQMRRIALALMAAQAGNASRAQ